MLGRDLPTTGRNPAPNSSERSDSDLLIINSKHFFTIIWVQPVRRKFGSNVVEVAGIKPRLLQ